MVPEKGAEENGASKAERRREANKKGRPRVTFRPFLTSSSRFPRFPRSLPSLRSVDLDSSVGSLSEVSWMAFRPLGIVIFNMARSTLSVNPQSGPSWKWIRFPSDELLLSVVSPRVAPGTCLSARSRSSGTPCRRCPSTFRLTTEYARESPDPTKWQHRAFLPPGLSSWFRIAGLPQLTLPRLSAATSLKPTPAERRGSSARQSDKTAGTGGRLLR